MLIDSSSYSFQFCSLNLTQLSFSLFSLSLLPLDYVPKNSHPFLAKQIIDYAGISLLSYLRGNSAGPRTLAVSRSLSNLHHTMLFTGITILVLVLVLLVIQIFGNTNLYLSQCCSQLSNFSFSRLHWDWLFASLQFRLFFLFQMCFFPLNNKCMMKPHNI